MESTLHVLGLMSGSSVDGLDMALCSFNGRIRDQMNWACLSAKTISFDKELKSRLSTASELSAKEILALEVDFTTFCVTAITAFQKGFLHEIDYIAHHGHTVFHFPEIGYTHQIVNGAQIAAQTGISSIVDFRSQDVALGGQGAPIAPIVEQWLLKDYNLFLNLGGIANLSIHKSSGEIIAYDVCPCNQTLNHIAQELGLEYDAEGKLAAQGSLISELLEQWNAVPYFSAPYPKSLDNKWCRDQFTTYAQQDKGSHEDRLYTTIDFITTKITEEFSQLLKKESRHPKQILVTGGGAYNSFLIQMLSEKTRPLGLGIVCSDNQIIDYKEAILMALMGYLRIQNIPNTIPSVTGALKATVGGSLNQVFVEL